MVSDFELEMDALFNRISSPESRRASDSLISLSGADLAATYEPGKTETSHLITNRHSDKAQTS